MTKGPLPSPFKHIPTTTTTLQEWWKHQAHHQRDNRVVLLLQSNHQMTVYSRVIVRRVRLVSPQYDIYDLKKSSSKLGWYRQFFIIEADFCTQVQVLKR